MQSAAGRQDTVHRLSEEVGVHMRHVESAETSVAGCVDGAGSLQTDTALLPAVSGSDEQWVGRGNRGSPN
jgi:hypothetical protein